MGWEVFGRGVDIKEMETEFRVSVQEYLKRERNAEMRSEYHGGIIVALVGSSIEHNRINRNLLGELHAQLQDGPCEIFISGMLVRIPECNKYYYPDLVVVCGDEEYEEIEGVTSLRNPILIIEVLSESTEAKDRGEKWRCYQTLASLESYVLIAQDEPRTEMFRRQADGLWLYSEARGMENQITLEAIGCTLRLADIYARITFPSTTPAEQSP